MTTVTIQKTIPSITVVSTGGGGFSTSPISAATLVNQGAQNSLSGLSDFVPGTDGGVLTYDAADNKYKIEQVNVNNSPIDGGSF